MSEQPLTDDDLREIERRAKELHEEGRYKENEFPVTGLLMQRSATDMIRLVSEMRGLRAENEKLKHDVVAIAEREIQRAESMGNYPDEYPKQYVDGRYRTAIEILGQFRMMFIAPNFPLGRITTDVSAKPGIVVTPPSFAVGDRVRLRDTERVHVSLDRSLFDKVLTVISIGEGVVNVKAKWGDEPGQWIERWASAFEAVD